MSNNILFVLKHFSKSGGVEKVSLNLAYQFKKEGHKVSFFIMDGEGIPDQLLKDFSVFLGKSSGLKSILLLVPRLIKWIKEGQYTAVIAAKEQANLLTYIASICYRSFTPIYTRHCAFDVSDQELSVKNIKRLYGLYGKGKGKIVAVSEDLASYIKGNIPSISKQVYFCPNPVINQELINKATINTDGFNHSNQYFCAVGRLCEQKGYDLLLNSYAQALKTKENLPDLVIVGDGELEAELKLLADKLSIAEKVKFNGFTTNPYYIIKNSEMFLLSSRHEGLPTVLIEALALKKKVVAFDCPTGPREILKDGLYGSLVEDQNITLFARAIIDTFESDLTVPDKAIESYTYSKSTASYRSLMD
ncbi:MAG: glycosyltransferase [Oceanospirillaceae bacterium]